MSFHFSPAELPTNTLAHSPSCICPPDKLINVLSNHGRNPFLFQKKFSYGIATVMGIGVARLIERLGIEAWFRHYVGHVVCGVRMVFKNAVSQTVIPDVSALQNVGRHSSVTEKIAALFYLLFGSASICTSYLGRTFHRLPVGPQGVERTEFGNVLRDKGAYAWIPFAGVLPQLVSSTFGILEGMRKYEDTPISAHFWMGYSLYSWISVVRAPIYSLWKIINQGPLPYRVLHRDTFDDFIVRAAYALDWTQTAVAGISTTALVFFPWIFAGLYYCYQKTEDTVHISNGTVLHYMLTQPEDQDEEVHQLQVAFHTAYSAYPEEKQRLTESTVTAYSRAVNHYLASKHQENESVLLDKLVHLEDQLAHALSDLEVFILDNIPPQTLRKAKRKIFHLLHQQPEEPSRWSRQWVVQCATMLCTGYSLTIQASKVFATAFPTAQKVISFFQSISPIATPIAKCGSLCTLYLTVMRWKNEIKRAPENTELLHTVRWLAIAEIVIRIAMELVLHISAMYKIAIPLHIVGSIAIWIIRYENNRRISYDLRMTDALQPTRWDAMLLRLKLFHHKHPNMKSYDPHLAQWVAFQKDAMKGNRLTAIQVQELLKQGI